MLCAQVVEGEFVGFAILLYKVANSVGYVVLQVAAVYIKYLVECAGDMESGCVAVGKFAA